MAHGEVHHDYHLVDPSPWPIVGAAGAFVMLIGAVFWMNTGYTGFWGLPVNGQPWVFVLGFVLVLYTMAGWWRDVVRESVVRGDHKPVVKLGLRYGMILFIASEVLFFAAFFWAFFDASLFPNAPEMPVRAEATGGIWPPKGISVIAPFDLPFMNTLILLLSGTTVTWAHHAILEGNKRDAVRGLTLTVILGICFTGIQAYEYFNAPFSFRENIYSSTFFMATGFHGFHVLVGTTFLLVCLFRAMAGQFKPTQHFGFEAAAWYWHFVDVVWLFLFFCIYWWGSGKAPIALH